jgi:hypothetical protein
MEICYIFPRFGILYQEKSGNPAARIFFPQKIPDFSSRKMVRTILMDPNRNRGTGLPDFSGHNVPKRGKYTKLPQHYLMAINYTRWR